MTDEGARALAAAVCVQAIKDYEHLCRELVRGRIMERDGKLVAGPTSRAWRTPSGQIHRDEVPNYSFAEIETFFITCAELYADMNPEIILGYLQRMKGRAMRTARHKFAK